MSEIAKRSIRYIPGMPKEYRSDCSKGSGYIKDYVTKKEHKTFTLHPIGYRFFTDKLFDGKTKNIEKNWAELFFIDESNCVSTVLFHGYSVDNLKKTMSLLYYAGHELHEVALDISYKEIDGKESKFFIAEFMVSEKQPDHAEENLEFARKNKIYRGDTYSNQAKIELSFNYPDFDDNDHA